MESVCVIGAGGAGLAVAQAPKARGVPFVVHEAGSGIGGNRRYDNELYAASYRRLLLLADLTVAQVADTLGLPTGTVKARLSRARAALSTLHPTRRATTCQHSTGAST